MKHAMARRALILFVTMLLANVACALPHELPIALDTPTGTIAGTLQLPDGSNKPRVALIIAGSGPTDRDGNSGLGAGRNDSLKLLAVQLAEAGYASVRYDKRGIGASRAAGPAEADLRFDTYVDDASAWLKKLKDDRRFAAPFVIGHSEGSLIGMLAAQRGGATAFVSIAGPAEPAGVVLRKQLTGKLPPELAAENERILTALEQGRAPGDVPPALHVLYRPSVQPYLISWMRHDPSKAVAALRMPVLIVQGGTDIQVGQEQAQALQAAKPDATLALIADMNHVLKQVSIDPAAQAKAYADPTLPLHPALIGHIKAFLAKQK